MFSVWRPLPARLRGSPVWMLGLGFAAVLVFGLAVGGASLDWQALWAGDLTTRTIFWQLRVPRVVMAALCGAGLAVAGAMMQAMFRNPLADPALIGVSSGAALGAIGALVLFGPTLAAQAVWLPLLPTAAFIGALACTGALLWFARQETVASLLLAGVAFNALCGAAIGALTWLADDARLRNITFWLMGSFSNADWTMTLAAAPFLVLPMMVAPLLARPLNALLLGEIEAGYLGFAVVRLKRQLVLLAALAVGAAVACAGVIGFVGLLVPHIARALAGPDHHRVLPVSALVGAVLCVGADAVARSVVAPAELPVGVLLSVIGAPYFLWLLKTQGR